MAISLKWWLEVLFSFLEKLKGITTVQQMQTPAEFAEYLKAFSASGYEMRIYCQKKHYRRRSQWWFSRNFTVYRVFCTVTDTAPVCLKDACALDIDFPALVSCFLGERLQKEMAVQAYLDLLIARLQSNN